MSKIQRMHLQLFANRLIEISEGYRHQIKWIYSGILPHIENLLLAINSTCYKQLVTSQRSMVFDDVSFCREILLFIEPIKCCGNILYNSDTLTTHIINHEGPELDADTTKLVIMFNLYVQIGTGILILFDNTYEMMDQHTAKLMEAAVEQLTWIKRKPVRRDGYAADTFVQGTFAKWKYVFDYTCTTCSQCGLQNCRYDGAIAWMKVFKTTLEVNPIRHLGTQMHAASLRSILPDRLVPKINEPRQEPQWSEAGMYLLNVQEAQLDVLCNTADNVWRDTGMASVEKYLKKQLEPILTNITVKPFGSRITGVADHKSDLDLQVSWEADVDNQTALSRVFDWAKSNSLEVKVRRRIPAGPLLLTLEIFKPLNLILDLTFANPYVVANSMLIKEIFYQLPNARKMFFLLKEWKIRAKLSKNFHHHIFIMMIVFYLQQEQSIPPITALLKGSVMLNEDTYNTEINEPITLTQRPTNLLALLKGFFAYWSEFNWAVNGPCMSEGQVKPKESFRFTRTTRKSVPLMMASDYFDQARNIAGNIKTTDYNKFIQCCKEAAEVLKLKESI